jgi:hypothetical protein
VHLWGHQEASWLSQSFAWFGLVSHFQAVSDLTIVFFMNWDVSSNLSRWDLAFPFLISSTHSSMVMLMTVAVFFEDKLSAALIMALTLADEEGSCNL